jgi:omega-6 fatty acid desaturase (delta-12 desaturase)
MAQFRASSWTRGFFQLGVTVPALLLVLAVMYLASAQYYWLTLLLSPLAAGFFVRTFILMHDCAHGSFLPSKRANEIVGFLTGVMTFTPFGQWRRDHARHHATSGDLDRRGHGDIDTLTVQEYLALDRMRRFKYRLVRHPLVMFGIGPVWLFAKHRVPHDGWSPRSAPTRSVYLTNVAVILMLAVAGMTIGFAKLALVLLPPLFMAYVAGIWLFYVQHQFEDTYWATHSGWDYETAALRGSSYFRLPPVLEWFTGSIGRHHVHHFDPRVPNYLLRNCQESTPELGDAPELTLRTSLHTLSLKLWDPERGRLIRFDELR